MINLRKNRQQAVNYSTVMEVLNYSQASLKALKPRWNELFFSETPINENVDEVAQILELTPGSITAAYAKVRAILDKTHAPHSILTLNDETYPTCLRQLQEPPPVLFVRGITEYFDTKCVAVVGSRSASEEGRKRAQKLAMLLCQHDYTVVSGLAKGIDTAAHTAAIKFGGRTIAVIGTRLTQSYPVENTELQEKIANGNLLVSQFPYAQPTSPYNFPQRNYTMMGIAQATVIVEAGETSGALIQARHCLREGRRLFIMQSLIDDPNLKWPKSFLKRGAIPLAEIDQLMDKLASPPLPQRSALEMAEHQLTLFA